MIRFHLDENVNHAIAHGLRLRGLDVTTATDAGLIGALDGQHVAFALANNRVVFTQDDCGGAKCTLHFVHPLISCKLSRALKTVTAKIHVGDVEAWEIAFVFAQQTLSEGESRNDSNDFSTV